MTTETCLHHTHILAVTDREPPLPPLVYLTDMHGHTERLALVDAQRMVRRAREWLEVLEAAERMLAPEPHQDAGDAPGAASDAPASS